MKKLIVFIGCLVVLTFSVSAIEISGGIGVDLGFVFTSIDTNIPEPDKSELNETVDSTDIKRWGISAFFDAQYIEANLGFKFRTLSYNESGYRYEEKDRFFNFGLNLKYPFQITERLKLFPLAGFDYSIFTSGTAKDMYGSISMDRDDLLPSDVIDKFSINLGIGVDYYIIQKIYIRGEFCYSFLLDSEGQKETINQIEALGYDLSIFEHGPVFKLAIGYRFM